MNEINISRFFPKWHVVRQIGFGGFGQVYEIEREQFGKIEKAALKVMHIPQNPSVIESYRADGYDDASIKIRLKNELEAFAQEYSNMRKLTHTNIVNCDDMVYELLDGGMKYNLYLKMELLTPLQNAVSGYFDPEQTAVKLGRDICSALKLCEERKIVHRDIKPQNLFVNSYGEFKLGDFGIAREMRQTEVGTVAGTYRYMAPEVFHHQPYDSSVDVYSLGLVLYWLLNEKRMPFVPLPPAVASDMAEQDANIKRLCGEPLPPPKNGSAELKRIVMKACEPDRNRRYRSAREMFNDLYNLGRQNGQVNYRNAPKTQNTRTIGNGFVMTGTPTVGAESSTGYEEYKKREAEKQRYEQKKAQDYTGGGAGYGGTQAAAKKAAPSIASADKIFNVAVAASIIASVLWLIAYYYLNFAEYGFKTYHVLIPIAFGVIVAGVRYNSFNISDAGKIIASVLFAGIIIAGAVFTFNIYKNGVEEKRVTPQVVDGVVVIDNAVKADRVYEEIKTMSEDDIEKKYGTDTFEFKNCKVDTNMTAVTESYYTADDYRSRFKLDGNWYEIVTLTTKQKSDFESLNEGKTYNIMCDAAHITDFRKNAVDYTEVTKFRFSDAEEVK